MRATASHWTGPYRVLTFGECFFFFFFSINQCRGTSTFCRKTLGRSPEIFNCAYARAQPFLVERKPSWPGLLATSFFSLLLTHRRILTPRFFKYSSRSCRVLTAETFGTVSRLSFLVFRQAPCCEYARELWIFIREERHKSQRNVDRNYIEKRISRIYATTHEPNTFSGGLEGNRFSAYYTERKKCVRNE